MLKYLISALTATGLIFLVTDNFIDLSEPGIYIAVVPAIFIYRLAKRGRKSEARSFMVVACQPARAVPLNENGAKKRLG